MTNDELAAEIERLWKAEQHAEAAHATLHRRLYWNSGTHAEYDELGRLRSARVEARGRASALMVKRIDAILTALRTPAAAGDDEAVERWAAELHAEFGDEPGIEDWEAIGENLREAYRIKARRLIAALAAMPGAGVVPTRDQLVSALQGAWDEFCGDAQAHPECFWREGRKLYADFDRSNFVQMVQYHLAAALSALPPPAAESRAREVHSDFRELMDAAWAINDKLRITPGMEAIFTGSTNDIDRFRDLLHDLEPAYRTAQEPAAGEQGDHR